jgi:hypothetical protein
MAGDLIEHVVKEANAGVHLALTRAVQVELHPDAGFGGLAADVGGACVHGVAGLVNRWSAAG